MVPRTIGQKIPIQKKNRIPVRLTRTRTPIGTLAPLPHPAFSPQLLPVLAHDWELSEEEILTNEAPPPPPRKTGPPKGRKKRPETGRSGTAAVPRDSPTTIAQPSRKHIQLPLPPNGRARRLVCSSALDIWCAVTMRGDVQFINGIEQ
jgi:hypothetical protein